MKLIRNLLLIFIFAFAFWYLYGEAYEEDGVTGVIHVVDNDLNRIINHPIVTNTIKGFQSLIESIAQEDLFEDEPPIPQKTDEKDLKQPEEQLFSIHNIEIGDKRADVEQEAGKPQRSSLNEYGVHWDTYHENYENFFMAAYNEDDHVIGLYTSQNLLASKTNISLGSTREEVLAELGTTPVDTIRKGFVNYKLNSEGEYDVFHINNQYITVFYDVHENNKVSSILLIDETMEQRKKEYFGEPSEQLKEGFEYQLFDLTNAARVKFGLSILQWEKPLIETARKHSKDMAANNYFSHTNRDGQSPFDRMQEDGISFQMAGENLAAGQPSSIFAHEGLMNSLGHRENILNEGFSSLAVGVAFNENAQPYYTENFITK